MKDAKDWVIDCLEKPKTGSREGEGGKETVLRERTKGVKSWAVGWSKKPNTIVHKREGSKKITLRVIELSMAPTPPMIDETVRPTFHLGSVKVEEYKVQEVDSNSP